MIVEISETFVCYDCDKFFLLESFFNKHLEFCEGKEMITQPEVWNCDECGKFYEDKMKF